jgi:hypothetical protein
MNAYVIRRSDGSYRVVLPPGAFQPIGGPAPATLTLMRDVADLQGDRWYVAPVLTPTEYVDACHAEAEDVQRWASEDAHTLQTIARHAVDRYRARQAREAARTSANTQEREP